MRTTNWDRFWFALLLAAVAFAFFVALGCASSKPTVVYEPIEVFIEVPVDCPDLPLPEPVDCGERGEGWRDDAIFLKTCYEAAMTKIEELIHVIESHNASGEGD